MNQNRAPLPGAGKPAPREQHQQSWIAITLFTFGLYYLLTQVMVEAPKSLSYSEFRQAIDAGQIAEVQITGHELKGRFDNSEKQGFDFVTTLPVFEDQTLLRQLESRKVNVSVKPDQSPLWLQLVLGFLPWLLIIGAFFYSSRLMQQRAGGLFDFSRSRARRYERESGGPGYDEVAGLDNAKRELQEIVDFLKEPERFRKLGAKMPKGILMMGPPGTGKTLLAKATANEAQVPFFSISGSEFIEMYVGVGAGRVRDMFAQARKEAPALIFIDEIDSVGRSRGTGLGGGHDEREQTLNQILAEMDGFDPHEAVVVLAATNRPDVLDAALLRPGRFDRKVVLELPHREARREILKVHMRAKPVAADVDVEALAAVTVGFSGADLANLVNEAALNAARERRDSITPGDFDNARDKLMLGLRRDSMLTPADRARVAAHESGHAIVACLATHSDPVERVSIVPRGRALGITEQRLEEDRYMLEQPYVEEQLQILMAGRCAEKLFFDSYSSGAVDDLQRATRLARKMVSQWGMSDDVGPLGLEQGAEHPFLGKEITMPRDFSEQTAQAIDRAVIAMLKKAEQSALATLTSHQDALRQLQASLLEHETMDRESILALLQR